MSKVNTKIIGNSYQYFNKDGSGLIYYPCSSSPTSQDSQLFLEKNKKKAVTRSEVNKIDESHPEFFIKSFGIFGYLTKNLVLLLYIATKNLNTLVTITNFSIGR